MRKMLVSGLFKIEAFDSKIQKIECSDRKLNAAS